MSNNTSFQENNLTLSIPIFIGYPAIDAYIHKTFVGEIISKEDSQGKESKYAEILDISLKKSEAPEFDVLITVKLETLTFLFRNRTVEARIFASLTFDSTNQVISIDHFEIDGKGNNWLTDKVMESVVNRFLYDRLKSRLQFDLKPQIDKQLQELNLKLEHRLEVQEGLFVIGSMDKLIISKLEARERGIWVFLDLEGWGIVEIEEIIEPAK